MIAFLSAASKLSSVGHDDSSFLCELHYFYARNFFVFSFALSVTRQLFGYSVVCHRLGAAVSDVLLQTSCLINGTYTVAEGGATVSNGYYQWMSLFLLLESLALGLPYHVWSRLTYSSHALWDASAEVCVGEIERSGRRAYLGLVCLEVACLANLFAQVGIVHLFFEGRILRSDFSVAGVFPTSGTCSVDFYNGCALTTGRGSAACCR